MEFKDLFSTQAADYAKFRPRYPDALYDYLAGLAPERALAWDCGTGNGQAAVALARRFESVVATDPSSKQLAQAQRDPKVRYAQGDASRAPLGDASCDLVTAAQAFHWFDQEAFYREARRVLKPRGVVAIWCYVNCEITPPIDAVVHELYEDVLGPYWEPERRQVEQGYARARFPFEELKAPPFEMEESWELKHLIGYLSTWSSLQSYLSKHGGPNPLEGLAPRLKAAWGEQALRVARWRLATRVGRV